MRWRSTIHFRLWEKISASNFLDLPAVEALERMMNSYIGTILLVTHDNRLLENVADIVYEIRDKKIIQRPIASIK